MDGKGCNVIVDTVVYALLNKKIRGLMSGVQSVTVDGTTLKFVFNDGSTQNMVFPNPKSGASITDVNIKEISNEYHLICTITDADGNETEIDAGIIPNVKVQIASKTTAGIVKVGDNLEITSDGTLSAIGGGKPYEISKADYDALTEEERKDKVFYVYDDDEGYDGGGGASLDGNDLLDEEITFVEQMGGIDANTTFPVGTPLEEIIRRMANKLVMPKVTLSSSLSTLTYILGTTVYNGHTLTAKVTKGSSDITKVEFFKNNTSVSVIENNVSNGGNFTYTDGLNITADVTYKVVVTNVEGKTVSSTLSVKFYNPYYHGVTSKDLNTITSTDITAMTKDVSAKGTKEYKYTGNNEYCCISYPKNYGLLSSILDGNGFQNLDSWTSKEIEISGVQYYIYQTNTSVICTNFLYKFEY